MSPRQVVRILGKQKEGYGNIKVLAGGVDAWNRAGHGFSGDTWNKWKRYSDILQRRLK